MALIWCPYVGKEIDEATSNLEHVIPGILGGTNAFTIRTDAKKNNDLGSVLDEAVASLPLISHAVLHYGLRGHRKQRNRLVIWPTTVRETKGRMVFDATSVTYQTFRSYDLFALNTSRPMASGEVYTAKLAIDEDVLLSFGAKVALGAGWYFYGETFRKWGYHAELRALMDAPLSIHHLQQTLALPTNFWAVYWPRSLDPNIGQPCWHALSRLPDRHLIWTLHTVGEVIMGVSLFGGLFPFYFNIARDATEFPIGGSFDLGAVLEMNLRTRRTRRQALREYLLAEFSELLGLT